MTKAPNRANDAGAFKEDHLGIIPRQAHRMSHRDHRQGELFAPSPVTLRLPNRGTLAHRLLQRLVQGQAVTQPEWLEATGSWRLAATVHTVEAEFGWPVRARPVSLSGRTIAAYKLPRRVLSLARALVGGAQ